MAVSSLAQSGALLPGLDGPDSASDMIASCGVWSLSPICVACLSTASTAQHRLPQSTRSRLGTGAPTPFGVWSLLIRTTPTPCCCCCCWDLRWPALEFHVATRGLAPRDLPSERSRPLQDGHSCQGDSNLVRLVRTTSGLCMRCRSCEHVC